ncbi:hypothetical protein FOPE_01700 [Fonsecaea pedrosoi]|nr:hypothetical protein FOPE_01700 [Fonsecaea pedrosoi]
MGLLHLTVALALAASTHSLGLPANHDTTITETLTRFVFTCPCDSTTSVSIGTTYPTLPTGVSDGHDWHDWVGSVSQSSGALTSSSSSLSRSGTGSRSATNQPSPHHTTADSSSKSTSTTAVWTSVSTSLPGTSTGSSITFTSTSIYSPVSPSLSTTAIATSSSPTVSSSISTSTSTLDISTSTTETTSPLTPGTTSTTLITTSSSECSFEVITTTLKKRDVLEVRTLTVPAADCSTTTSTSGIPTTTPASSSTASTASTTLGASSSVGTSSTTPADPATSSSIGTSTSADPDSLPRTTSLTTVSVTLTTSGTSSTTLTADTSAPSVGQPFSIQVNTAGPGKHKRDILVVGYVNGALVLVSSPADAVAFVLTSDGVLMIFGTTLVVGFGGGSGTSALMIYSSVSAMPTTIVWSISGGALVLPGAGFCVGAGNVMSVNVGSATDSSCAPVTPVPDTDTDSYNTEVASTVTPSPQTSPVTTQASTSTTVDITSTTSLSSLTTTPIIISSTSSLTSTVYVSTSSQISDSTTSGSSATTTTTTATKTEETSGPNCSILPLQDQTAPSGTQYTQFFYSCFAAIPTTLGDSYSLVTSGDGDYSSDPTAFLNQCVATAEQLSASVWTYYQSSSDFKWHCGFWTGLVADDGIFVDDETVFTMNAMTVLGGDDTSSSTSTSSSSTATLSTFSSQTLTSSTLTTTSSSFLTTTTTSVTSTTSSANCVATSASVGDVLDTTTGNSWINFFSSGCGLSLDWQTLDFNNLYVYQRTDYTFEEALLECAQVADNDGSPVFEFETDIRNNNRWVCWTLNGITNDPAQFQPYPGIADAYGWYLPSRMVSVTTTSSTTTSAPSSTVSTLTTTSAPGATTSQSTLAPPTTPSTLTTTSASPTTITTSSLTITSSSATTTTAAASCQPTNVVDSNGDTWQVLCDVVRLGGGEGTGTIFNLGTGTTLAQCIELCDGIDTCNMVEVGPDDSGTVYCWGLTSVVSWTPAEYAGWDTALKISGDFARDPVSGNTIDDTITSSSTLLTTTSTTTSTPGPFTTTSTTTIDSTATSTSITTTSTTTVDDSTTATSTPTTTTSTIIDIPTSAETFYIAAETGVAGRRIKRGTQYLVLSPQTGLSSLVDSQSEASTFVIADDESLMVVVSGTPVWVGFTFTTPTQIVMATVQPDPPVTATIHSNGLLTISSVVTECSLNGGLVVSTDGSIPEGCIQVTLKAVSAPIVDPVSSSTSTSSSLPVVTTSGTTITTGTTTITTTATTPTPTCTNGEIVSDANGDTWETLCGQGSVNGWTYFSSFADVATLADCIAKCNEDGSCNAVSIEYRDLGTNMCGFIYTTIDFQPYDFTADTAIKVSGANARPQINFSGSSTTTTTTTTGSVSSTATTSATSTTTIPACTPSAIGDVTALYDTTQTFRNVYTGCGESLEGATTGGLQYLPKQFAVQWQASDNYEGWTFEDAVSRCVQTAVDNAATAVEFYVDVDQNWLCVGVDDLTLDDSSFYADPNVINVWGFVWENSCQNSPLDDIVATDGTVFSEFYTGCSASLQGNIPGGLQYLNRVVSVQWPAPDYADWTFDAAVKSCADQTVSQDGTMFEFYIGADDSWYCVAVNDLPIEADSFSPDATVGKVWGFAITQSTEVCEPSQLAGSVQLANGTTYDEFYDACHVSLEGINGGGPGSMTNVFGFNNPPGEDGNHGGWTLETSLQQCITDSAAAGATLVEFYENADEDPTWYCFGVTDVPADEGSFYGDDTVGRLWAFQLDESTLPTND